jgi:hypothetical protein
MPSQWVERIRNAGGRARARAVSWRCTTCGTLNSGNFVSCRDCNSPKPTRRGRARSRGRQAAGVTVNVFKDAWRGHKEAATKEALEKSPHKVKYIEDLEQEGEKWFQSKKLAKAGLFTQASGNVTVGKRIKDHVIEITGLLIAAAVVGVVLNFVYVAAALVLLAMYVMIPGEDEILDRELYREGGDQVFES